MRINKKFIPSSKAQQKQYLTIDFENIDHLVLALIILGLIFGVLFVGITFARPSKAETAYYQNTCNMLAGNAKHYFTRQGSTYDTDQNSMKCHVLAADGTEKEYKL